MSSTTCTTVKYVPPFRRRSESPSNPPLSILCTAPPSPPRTPSPPASRVSVCWRSTAAPPAAIRKVLPSFDDVEAGMVFYLPDEGDMLGSRIHESIGNQPQSPWCHPAVITRKGVEDDGEECVEIRLCTSFGGMDVVAKKPLQQQALFMLASNSEDENTHGGTCLARLQDSGRFGKRTYVNLSRNSVYTVEYRRLTAFKGKPPMQFDAVSTQKIIAASPY
ncbi:hypothetical protein ACEQ8H_001947 [Pleosporales sp. CAS-2024a]